MHRIPFIFTLIMTGMLFQWGCSDEKTVYQDSSTADSLVSDGAPPDRALPDLGPDGPAADARLCVSWKDMGIDCCDVCTEIYDACDEAVKDSQGNVLGGEQCIETCMGTRGWAANAYAYVDCMMDVDQQSRCATATLQACFDKMFE